MAVQRGRSERRGESYSVPYVEPRSDARTKVTDFFSILLVPFTRMPRLPSDSAGAKQCTPILQPNGIPHINSRRAKPILIGMILTAKGIPQPYFFSMPFFRFTLPMRLHSLPATPQNPRHDGIG
jgi:hypothetical protein